MTSFDIERLPFTQEHLRSWQADDRRFINWPVVYILDDGKRAYVGETLNTAARMRQHLESAERKTLKAVRLVLDDTFNKSGPSLAVHHDDLREQTAQDARVRGFVALRAIGCGIENDADVRPPIVPGERRFRLSLRETTSSSRRIPPRKVMEKRGDDRGPLA